MPISIIVSYDGTTHDDDALMLGRMLLVTAGASLSLAYVRHSREYDPRREEIGVHDASPAVSNRGRTGSASWTLVPQHVVVNPLHECEGLAALATDRVTPDLDRVRFRLPHPARARRAGRLGAGVAQRRQRSRLRSPPPASGPNL